VHARDALDRAVGLMRERLDHGAGTSEDRARLAGWLANLDRREEALEAIRGALELDPSDVHVQVEAAKVYLHVGCRERALLWLKEAVRNGYGVDFLRRSPERRPLVGDAEYEAILTVAPGSGARGTNPTEPKESGS
jgi:tetratricopeptide (TPR) repeat protein